MDRQTYNEHRHKMRLKRGGKDQESVSKEDGNFSKINGGSDET